MRKLASIQKIISLEPIPNADSIERAQVLGWQCVVKKGEFKAGDLVVYFEVDSFLPIRETYEFLRKQCYKKMLDEEGFRLRTIRLRGQVSQGLVMPLSVIEDGNAAGSNDFKEGEDVTELLKVKLYQPPIPAELMGKVKGQFPSFIPKTDETRVQVLQGVLDRHEGLLCYVTEKIDGASVTYYIKGGEFGVCSRNLELYETPENGLWRFARDNKIEEKLKEIGINIAIQGEFYGEGINGNNLRVKGHRVAFFNVFYIDTYQYEGYGFAEIIGKLGLETVPIVMYPFNLINDIPTLVQMSQTKSVLNPNVEREGIVIRPIDEKMDLQMSSTFGNGRLTFKVINPEFLLLERD